jgi:hypothetical protein
MHPFIVDTSQETTFWQAIGQFTELTPFETSQSIVMLQLTNETVPAFPVMDIFSQSSTFNEETSPVIEIFISFVFGVTSIPSIVIFHFEIIIELWLPEIATPPIVIDIVLKN